MMFLISHNKLILHILLYVHFKKKLQKKKIMRSPFKIIGVVIEHLISRL